MATLREPLRIVRPLVGASILLALGLLHAVVAVRYPFIDLAAVALSVFASFPQVPQVPQATVVGQRAVPWVGGRRA